MINVIVLMIVGLGLLIAGSELLIHHSSAIAKSFHISDFIIGLTIVAIGTSLPELFIGITSSISGHSDMNFGNIIGSNIINIFLILGISSLFHTIVFDRHTKRIDIPLGIIFSVLTFVFALTGSVITRAEASLMVLFFIGYFVYTIGSIHKKHIKTNSIEISLKELLISLLCIVASIFLLKYGSDFVVDNAISLSELLEIDAELVGLTIVAIGTALPEIVTTLVSSIRGKHNIAVGNMIGSTIINTLLILGISGIVSPLHYDYTLNTEFLIAILAPSLLLLFSYMRPENKMTKWNGVVFIALYIGYLFITCFS